MAQQTKLNTQTCLVGHTLSAVFVVPVHSTYSVDLSDSQYLYIVHNAKWINFGGKNTFREASDG